MVFIGLDQLHLTTGELYLIQIFIRVTCGCNVFESFRVKINSKVRVLAEI